ncbi:MAG: hypothetical protein ABIV39_03495, partial [Verrucomicrobiota bacterium]
MIKAVKISFGLFILLGTAILHAQPNPAEVAEIEAVRRQEATITLHNKLLSAQEAQRKGFLVDAGKLYQEAVSLFPKVGAGPNVDLDKKQTVAGLVTVRLQLARDAQRRGNLAEADEQVSSALKIDSRNEALLKFKRENDNLILAQIGNIPSPETLSRVPDVQKEKIAAQTLVQDGKLLWEMGKLDEAEAKLTLALERDPANTSAFYYKNLVKESRYKHASQTREQAAKNALVEVQKAWDPTVKRDLLQIPNPEARTNRIYTTLGRQTIKSKLDRIRFPEVVYEGLPLGEVLKSLRDESKKRDPEQKGINFMFNPHSSAPSAPVSASPLGDPTAAVFTPAPAPPVDLNNITISITPALNDMRLADVLDAIVQVADQAIDYKIEDYAIVFGPKAPESVTFYTRQFKVNPNTFLQGLESVSALSISIQSSSGG